MRILLIALSLLYFNNVVASIRGLFKSEEEFQARIQTAYTSSTYMASFIIASMFLLVEVAYIIIALVYMPFITHMPIWLIIGIVIICSNIYQIIDGASSIVARRKLVKHKFVRRYWLLVPQALLELVFIAKVIASIW